VCACSAEIVTEKEFVDLTDSRCVRAVRCGEIVTEKAFVDLTDSRCVRGVQRDCDREGGPRFD